MYDYVVIGAGIIGLNIAKELKLRDPQAKIVILEKENDVGKHSSGRNSGVLHAGFYYTKDSLKAKFTKEGNKEIKNFCIQNNLKLNTSGKVVVAKNESEHQVLVELKKRADINDVELYWMSKDELEKKYPNVYTYKLALFSPTTATVDPIEVTMACKKYVLDLGVEIHMNCKYINKIIYRIC